MHKVATHGIQEQLSKSFCSATTELGCKICGHVYKGVFALKSFKSHIQKKHGVKDLSNIKRFYEASVNTGNRNSCLKKIVPIHAKNTGCLWDFSHISEKTKISLIPTYFEFSTYKIQNKLNLG